MSHEQRICIDVREILVKYFFYGVLDSTGSQRFNKKNNNTQQTHPRLHHVIRNKKYDMIFHRVQVQQFLIFLTNNMCL